MRQGEHRGGQTRVVFPTIACINRASSGLDVNFPTLISALQRYVDKHLAPEDLYLHRSEFRGA